MHELYSSFVLGYHGCERSVAERIFSGAKFQKSRNNYDWLGPGVYFWENRCTQHHAYIRTNESGTRRNENIMIDTLAPAELADTVFPATARRAVEPVSISPSTYVRAASLAERLAEVIDNHWDDIGEPAKAYFRLIAEASLHPMAMLRPRHVLALILSLVVFVVDREAVSASVTASVRLKRAVLDAMERENPEYCRALTRALTESLDSNRPQRTMSVAETMAAHRAL